MRIAITGATGLIGHHAARAALAAGHEVVALIRAGPRGAEALRGIEPAHRVRPVQRAVVELTAGPALTRALEGVDALIHCAAVYAYGARHASEVTRVNVDGTVALLESAAAAGVARAVVTSSSVTRGSDLAPVPRTEAGHLGWEPVPAYYASKVAQEQAALETSERLGIPVVLALPTVVLGGPIARLGPSNAIVLRYLLDPTRSTYPGGCNVVDARDVGTGHLLLLEHGTPGERYLLGGDDVSWRTLHTLVADLAGLPRPRAEIPAPAAWLASAAAEGWARLTSTAALSTREEASTIGRYYWYSCARARRLGYAAAPARSAIATSLAWLAIGPDLPRWVREGLRLHADVRAARPLLPRPLPTATPDEVTARRRPSRPVRPRRPR